jgi:hypothetical protein
MMDSYRNSDAFEDKKTKRIIFGVTWAVSTGLVGYFLYWWATTG